MKTNRSATSLAPRALALVAMLLPFAGCEACDPTVECRDNADSVCADDEQCFEDPSDESTGCAIACNIDEPCPENFACRSVLTLAGVEAGACAELTETRIVGDPCTRDTQCTTGVCEGAEDEMRCRESCTFDGGCEADTARCVLVGIRAMCLTAGDDGETGDTCISSQDCLSGICTKAPYLSPNGTDDSEYAICTALCSDNEVCPGAEVCGTLTEGVDVCLPSLPSGEPCTDNSQCPGALCYAETQGADPVCRERCANAKDPCATSETACIPLGDPATDPNTDYICADVNDDAGAPYPDATSDCDNNTDCLSGLCGQFGGGDTGVTAQEICAVACDSTAANACDACPTDSICWRFDIDATAVEGLCGPIPPNSEFPCLDN